MDSIDYVTEQRERLMETPDQYIEYLRRANRQKLRWLDEMQESVICQTIEAQANLQTALGILRLEMGQLPKDGIQQHNLSVCEDRLAKSLAYLHLLLYRLGNPMYSPATHPEVNGGKLATPIP